jgi:hypothetical protein
MCCIGTIDGTRHVHAPRIIPSGSSARGQTSSDTQCERRKRRKPRLPAEAIWRLRIECESGPCFSRRPHYVVKVTAHCETVLFQFCHSWFDLLDLQETATRQNPFCFARISVSDRKTRSEGLNIPEHAKSGIERCCRANRERWRYNRPVPNEISWVLRAGAPWRDLPQRYGRIRRLTVGSIAGARLVFGIV